MWRTDYGMLDIKNYSVVVWVCYVKYACGVVLFSWLCCVLVVIPKDGFIETLRMQDV